MIKEKRQAGRQVEKSDGNWVARNYWVKIGFTRAQLGALKQLAADFIEPKYQTTSNAAQRVLRVALAHWRELAAFELADHRYSEAEGFWGIEAFYETPNAAAFGLDRNGDPLHTRVRKPQRKRK